MKGNFAHYILLSPEAKCRFQSSLTCKVYIMVRVYDFDDSKECWGVPRQSRNEHDNDHISHSEQPENIKRTCLRWNHEGNGIETLFSKNLTLEKYTAPQSPDVIRKCNRNLQALDGHLFIRNSSSIAAHCLNVFCKISPSIIIPTASFLRSQRGPYKRGSTVNDVWMLIISA